MNALIWDPKMGLVKSEYEMPVQQNRFRKKKNRFRKPIIYIVSGLGTALFLASVVSVL